MLPLDMAGNKLRDAQPVVYHFKVCYAL